MRRRPGYLRIWLTVFRQMTLWASGREIFPWIVLGGPLAAWLLAGQASIRLIPLVISAVTWCVPAAFIAGWPGSVERAGLAGILYGSRAGRYSLVIPEIALPFLAGTVPAVIIMLVWSSGGRGVPWQLWTVIPFSALTAVSATILLEGLLGASGHLLALTAFLAQASTASWAASAAFQLLVLPGYTLWTIRWSRGFETVLHGDIYAFFAVLQGTGLAILAARRLLGISSGGKGSSPAGDPARST